MAGSYKADAVIVGGGLAGLATALDLLDAGRSVIILERGPKRKFGGLARWSFGGIFIVGSPEQRRSGIRDSVDQAVEDWLAYGELGPEDSWPKRWAEAYVAASREHVYDWLRGRGVSFFPVVNWVERGLYEPGNSVPRFHIVWGTGEGLVLALLAYLDDHPHRDRLLVLHHHRVTDLTSQAGHFVGCRGVVEPPEAGGGINVASGEFAAEGDCVVVATGGMSGNLDRVRRHWPADLGAAPELLLNGAQPAADGHLHDVAESYGANITHLDRMWLYAAGVRHWRPEHEHHGLSLVPPKSALWVDSRGHRLGPPPLVSGFDTRYLVETICAQPRQYSWQVLNQRIARRELAVSGSEFNPAMRDKKMLRLLATLLFGNRALVRELVDNCPDFVTAGSLRELAGRMSELAGNEDLDATVLEATVRRFDTRVRRGPRYATDDQLRRIAQVRRYRGDRLRTSRFAPIDDARARPLIAIREQITTRKSLGGIQTDLSSRVLDRSGNPMPGLFAVGEAAGFGGGGVHGRRSLEGTFLGGCIFTGRIAARAIIEG